MTTYIDTSVLLRVALAQPKRLKGWNTLGECVTSALTEVESLRTIDRLRFERHLSDIEALRRREVVFAILGEVYVVDVTKGLLNRAGMPLPSPLGTLDALHLVTALAFAERSRDVLTLATHDAALGRAARAVGLETIGDD